MSYRAVLVSVQDVDATKNRLPDWTQDDPDELIHQAQANQRPVITNLDCRECEEALEKDGAAEVEVEQC